MTSHRPLESERVQQERDLYLGLLGLNSELDPEPFLKKALELVAGIVGARRGYLDLFDTERPGHAFWHAVGFPEDQLERVRKLVSHGIIAEAVASERVVVTPSALLDPRFSDRASVQRSKIDAVICAPIGHDPPQGVLYLQSGDEPGDIFSHAEAERVEQFAKYLAPIARKVLLQRQASDADPTVDLRARLKANDIVGSSRALFELLKEVSAVAPLEVSLLLSGDTGTGKTQLARLIHRNSPRSGGPFVELNCAALPEQLIESELFGALPGAHSAATRRVEGKVAAASYGTLLLDEIAELSLPAQAKLLQLLQSKEYFPLGASRPVAADVRIIAATNVDLKEAVAERRFREDLYYRLQVVAIRVPSLSERKEDLAVLARYFCERAQKSHKLSAVELSPAALRALETAVWPGNIRQLANAVEGATIRAASLGLGRIEVAHLFPDAKPAGSADTADGATFQEATRRFQARLVQKTLESNDWNVSAAARQLDLTRAHLYNLIKSFGLSR